MKKLKILVVTQYFWPENFKINDLTFHLSKNGHTVDVLTGIPNYPNGRFYKGYSIFKKRKEIINNVMIQRVIISPRGKKSKLSLLLNYISFVISASLKIFFIKKKYDLIFVYEPSPITVAIPAIFFKKFTKTPMFLWVTDLWPESIIATLKPNKLLKRLVNFTINPIVKWIYRNTNKILVSSEGFIASIEKKLKMKTEIEFFPQWAESFFVPTKELPEIDLNFSKNSFKIMFAGNIGEAQDFPAILKTAKLLKNYDIEWFILGDGRKKDWVANKILDYGLEKKFHLIGSYPVEEMPKFYALSDSMLFSLKDDYIFSITIPAKVQSYLACAKPVLAMVNGEASKIIKDSKSGLVCRSGDYKQLANNIVKMSKMTKKEINLLEKNALKCYKTNFDRDMLFSKIQNHFYNAIK